MIYKQVFVTVAFSIVPAEMNQVSFVLATILACLALAEDTDNKEAKQFIDDVYKEMSFRLDYCTAKQWAYDVAPEANSNKELEEYNKADDWTATYQTEIFNKLRKFPWMKFKDQSLKRKFFAATMLLQMKSLPHDEFMELVDLKKDINKLSTTAKVKEMSSDDKPLLSFTDVGEKLKNVGLKEDELNYYWKEVHDKVAKEAKDPFTRFIELENKAADAIGYENYSKLLQAAYEVDDFEKTLHAYVRYNLWKAYQENNNIIDPEGPIPASLLGWKWGLDASPMFDQVAPFPDTPLLNITQRMKDSGKTVNDIIETVKSFYTSLGFSPLPKDFWKESVFEKNENINCESKVYSFPIGKDRKYRIIICAEPTEEGHTLLHSWVGYIQYLRAVKDLPNIYQVFPNYAFDNAFQRVLVKFSKAPNYLKSIGALDTNFQPDYNLKIKTLLKEAMEFVFSLPFCLAWDQWRWRVAEGKITPKEYNCEYWKMRTNLQGVEPPVDRIKNDFDSGARFRYIAGDDHMLYFIAEFLKHDMIRGLCRTSGYYDPQSKPDNALVFCDVHGSKAVGDKLKAMMALGASEPWYVALEKITGTKKLDSSALLEYYQPLLEWLQKYNNDNNVKRDWKSSNKCH